MSTLLIRGAKTWLGTGIGWSMTDVLVRDDKIEAIGEKLDSKADRVIDASGKLLIPGVIDPQVHFREPGNVYKEDLLTGSMACVAGGVTSFFEMPNTNPTTTTPERVKEKQEIAASKCLANFAFFVGATADNVDALNASEGVCGIKIFMGSSTGNLLVNEQAALERIFAETDPKRVIALHCEDENRILERAQKYRARRDPAVHSIVRDNEAAILATRRAVDLGTRYQHRTHILHVTTHEEVALFGSMADCITAECAPHHLLFNVDDYATLKGLGKMNPSLKYAEDNAALWEGLKDGRIDCVATDHAPHTWEEKTRENIWDCPAGIPAIENSLGVMLDAAEQGLCTIEQVLAWMCEKPAEIYCVDKKGTIAVGMDADLCIVNPNANHEVINEKQFTKSKWSPWAGRTFKAWPETTVVLGQVAFESGRPNMACRGRNIF